MKQQQRPQQPPPMAPSRMATSASDVHKDQAFGVTYVGEHRPDPSNLALIQAVQKTAAMWARDAEEALVLFKMKPPKGVHHIVGIAPAGMSRDAWIEFTPEERMRAQAAGVVIKP